MLQELSSLGFIWTSHKYNTDKYLNKHFQDLYINIIFNIKKFLYFLKWNRKWLCYFRKIHKRKLQTQDYKTSHILHVSPHITSSCRETLREAVISSNEIMWYLTWIRFSTYSCSPSLFSWWSSSVICWVHREAALLQRSSSNLLLLPSFWTGKPLW